MKVTPRLFVLCLTLGALAWLLAQPTSPLWTETLATALRLILPAMAVWLMARTMAALPTGWMWHRIFGTLAALGWTAVVLVALGRWEAHPGDRGMLAIAGAIALAVPVWMAIKTKTLPSRNAMRDAAAGLAIVVLIGAFFLWRYDARTRDIAAQAEARWTEIGLPMDAFEKTLVPVAENAGSKIVRQVLREQVGAGFYKSGTPAAKNEPAVEHSDEESELVNRACEIINIKHAPADELDLSNLPVSAIEPHAAALETAYQHILAAEPALWAFNPADGPAISMPNFLGLRMFAQLSAADSMRRLAAGDEKGAARAVEAGLRMPEGLDRSPTLVSLMIHVAVKALMAQEQVRLPAAPDGLSKLSGDTAAAQAGLIRTLQWESWVLLRHADEMSKEYYQFGTQSPVLPQWARRIADRQFMARQCAIAALNGANHVAIRQSPTTFALPDFGSSQDEAITLRNPSLCDLNVSRAAMRIYATLLLREQTELIRDARVRLAAGQPVESRNSVVLPSVYWELTADAGKRTVSTRMENAPEWIANGAVTGGDEFWILPLDGSVAWQFHREGAATAGQ